MILVIAVLLGLSLIGLGLMNQSAVNGVEAATEISKAQAFWTAEAGIERTRALAHKLCQSGVGELFPSTQPRVWTGLTAWGTFTITVTEESANPPGYLIISDGLSLGNDRRRLSLNIIQGPAMIAGVFGAIDLQLQPNTCVYSYHSSSNPTPTPATSTGEAIVGSNDEISMKTSNLIDGTILVGANEEGVPATTSGCEDRTLSYAGRIDPDPLGIRDGAYAILLNNAKTINNNSALPHITANTWVVPNNETSRVSAGVYYVTSIEIRGTVAITASNGIAEIFLSGPMKAWPSSVISSAGAASRFRIYSDSTANIDIQPSGDFGGLVYAPYSNEVRISPGNNFYGVIWADDIVLLPGGNLFVDADMLSYDAFRVFRISFANWKQLQ